MKRMCLFIFLLYFIRFQDSNQEMEKGAMEQRSRTILYANTLKILTKNCKREQGSNRAELYLRQYFNDSNQELEKGATEQGSTTIYYDITF